MNNPTSVAISTIAYTHMGAELLISGIITIAMHYGIANNPPAALVVYAATLTNIYAYPVWGGIFAILIGLCAIIVGSVIQNNTNSVKGFSFLGIIGIITQFIAFCFSCNSIATSVRFIRLNNGPLRSYNFVPIVYSVIYLIIFLTNFLVCLRCVILGRTLIRTYSTVVIQPASTVVIQTNTQIRQPPPPGYNTTMISKPPEVA